MSTNFLANYVDPSALISSTVDLDLDIEQVVPPKVEKYATLHDLYLAWLASASGASARQNRIKTCPIEFDGTKVRFFLGFYVWPSVPSMVYDLSASTGEIGDKMAVKVEKVVYDFLDNESDYELPYYMEGLGVDWTTKVYDSSGQPIPDPAHSSAGKSIKFNRSAFGEAEMSGKAVGDYYVLTIEIDKEYWVPETEEDPPSSYVADQVIMADYTPEEMNSFSVSSLNASITATWLDLTGKTQTLTKGLEIPECVKAVLEFCPGDEIMSYLSWCEESSDRVVYWSTCDGSVVDVYDGVDPRSYCTKMAFDYDVGPWLRRML